MKKKTKLIIAAALLVAVLAGIAYGVVRYQNEKQYNETYIVIDGTEYLRSSTALDLSGTTLTEVEKLKELTALESLDLRATGITIEQYNELRGALPECDILWSVPFQGSWYDSDIMVLDVTTLSEADLDTIAYFTRLKAFRAVGCTDYEMLTLLMERYPHLNVTYGVVFSGETYFNYSDSLKILNPDPAEFRAGIGYLPKVTSVTFEGELPPQEELLQLKLDYPQITFSFDFEVFGIAANTLDTFLDLSGIRFSDPAEVEAVLPYFYNLEQVDMVNCGLSNETMDALNKRYRDTKFVWTVKVCTIYLRTDAIYFMPVKIGIGRANSDDCYNLRYCTDMQAIDIGHYGTVDLSFVEHMPNLKYLLVCDSYCTDLRPIGNCTSLEYIELQKCKATDLWPLTNLTNLRDLNLAEVPFADLTPLTQMTWLDRLWVPRNNLSSSSKQILAEALPNTLIIYESEGHTTSGYRYTPRYFEQRDILGMYYKTN